MITKDQVEHIHIWNGPNHHHFNRKTGLQLSESDNETHQKSSAESASHDPGTVVAPMAGLVVKVLVKNGMKVEDEQPILVMEAMKMEHVVKAPIAGYIHGLNVTVGEQVYDGTVLCTVKKDE